MANRLTRIYTRTGDQGSTGLGNGERVAKTSIRIEAMGDIDELNCLIGMILAEKPNEAITEILVDIQHALFDAGGEISLPGEAFIKPKYVTLAEEAIDRLNAELGELKEFILPGGSRSSSICHYARAVCRRAERRLVCLAEDQTINEFTLKFINRLSDLLFVMARTLARGDNNPELMWNKQQWRDK